MKYIMRIDELYKKTYISASDKLKKYHPKRSEKLKLHAKNIGLSAKIDRIYPDKFDFNNVGSYEFRHKLQDDEYFYIVEISDRDPSRSNPYLNLDIKFISNYDNYIFIHLNMGRANHPLASSGEPTKFTPDRFKMSILKHKTELARHFLFRSRKEASSFKKFISEYIEDNLPDLYDQFRKISLNRFYTTLESPLNPDSYWEKD
jgi:hypothetical protein